ncbi:hypothetical protein Tco_0240712 [Tanacetum coccineum]
MSGTVPPPITGGGIGGGGPLPTGDNPLVVLINNLDAGTESVGTDIRHQPLHEADAIPNGPYDCLSPVRIAFLTQEIPLLM